MAYVFVVVVFVVLALVAILAVTVDIVVSGVVVIIIVGRRNLTLRFSKNLVSYSRDVVVIFVFVVGVIVIEDFSLLLVGQ